MPRYHKIKTAAGFSPLGIRHWNDVTDGWSVFFTKIKLVCVCVVDSEVSCLYQGTVYHSNEHWEVDECTSCMCLSGDVHCRSERCPPLTCANVSVY